MEFHNREKELEYFRNRIESREAEFLVLYGRRRVGKTELVKQFVEPEKNVYHLVSRETEKEQIEELKESIATTEEDVEDIKNEWLPVLKFAAENLDLLIIDEFPYLIETDKEILKIMQKAWDENMKKEDFNLVITGSSIGMMESEVLGYKSPLYGRRTGEWKLEPFEYTETAAFFPEYSEEDIIRTHAVLGGTPYYLQQFQQEKELEKNIRDNILKQGSILREEAERLLQQELRTPKNYFSCLKAIARGKNRFNEIRNETGIPQGSLSKYLKTLQNLQIIDKKLPVTASEKSKRGIYAIKDNYFSFWFRYLFPNQTMLQQSPRTLMENRIEPELDLYTSRKFEDMCRTYIRARASYDRVGSWWYQEDEIDVAAVNTKEDVLLLGECKWKKSETGTALLEKLKQKAEKVRWRNSQRDEKYVLFSREGFSEDLRKEDVELVTSEELFRRE